MGAGARGIGVLAMLSAAANAEPRGAIDLEPVTLYFSAKSVGRTQVSVLGYTLGYRFDHFVPYAGAAIGFFTLQARAGVSWLPGDLEEPGPMVRFEARPQLRFGHCWEPMLIGSLGAGYRWPLEAGDPGNPGTALYVLPAFTGGDGFLHATCGAPGDGPVRGTVLYGGTLSGGFDW